MKITVYTKPACVQCTAAKRYLAGKGITHDTVDITTDQAAEDLLRRSGFRSLPVIALDGIPVVAGFAPPMIDSLVIRPALDAA